MEGIKCPICKTVTVFEGVCDGELITCCICSSKFTVTPMRRFFIQPPIRTQISNKDLAFWQYKMRGMNVSELLELLELIASELKVKSFHWEKETDG